MGLNPHLINLMSLREKQKLERLVPTQPTSVGKSFDEALEESLAALGANESNGRNLSESQKLAEQEALRRVPSAEESRPKNAVNVASLMNPIRLQQRYTETLAEGQGLAIAAQRTPVGRYRVNPDDDTTGESETAANVRPIHS